MNCFASSRSRWLLAWLLCLGAGCVPGLGQMVTIGIIQDSVSVNPATRPWVTIDWPWLDQAINTGVLDTRSFSVRDSTNSTITSGTPINFGSTDIGGFKTQSFTVTNTFLATLTGLTCTLDGADAADFVLSTPTLADLAVGACTTFSITYVPELVGKTSAAVLHIRSATAGAFDFPLIATGGHLNPTVRVEEVGGAVVTSLSAPLDFGSPMLGQSTSKTFRITNTGTAPLREVSVARDDPWNYGSNYWNYWGIIGFWGYPFYYSPTYQYESGFTVTGLSSSIIPPGESRTITVTWKPYETEQKTRNITLSWAMREPPPTYDLTGGSHLTSGSLGQPILIGPITIANTGILIGNPFVPYTPPVRFSIPVTGAAVPYASEPPVLGGLQYHLGKENSTGGLIPSTPGQPPADPMLGTVSSCGPDSAGFVPSTLERWWPSALPFDPNNYGYLSNIIWRDYTRMQLSVTAQTIPDPVASQTYGVTVVKSPKSVYVTGSGSAADALGSRVAVAFTSGTRLTNPNIQLPASDNVGMELWLKPSSLAGTQCVACIGAAADAGFGLWLVDGVLHGRAGSSSIVATTPVLAVDVWHHVAFIVQGGSAALYADGVLAGSAPSVTLPTTVQGLSIGAMLDGSSGYEGQVDELRLFEVPASGFNVAHHLLANATPSAALDRSVIDFGHVVPAATTQRSATLANTGPGWLRVLAMEVTGDGASDYNVSALGPNNSSTPLLPDATPAPAYPTGGFLGASLRILFNDNSLPAYAGVGTSIAYRTAVAPQTKLEATITHTASTLGQRPATLRITTNDPAHPVHEIALNTTTVAAPTPAPKLSIQRIRINAGSWIYTREESWDWGTLLTNAESGCTFFVGNEGTAPLPSIGVEVIGPGAEDITLTGNGAIGAPGTSIVDGRVEIPNGGQPFGYSAYINLNVRPRAAGARYAALRITSDDPERPEVIIPIYGRGVQAVPEIAVAAWGNLSPGGAVSAHQGTLVADGGTVALVPALAGGNRSEVSIVIHNIGTASLEGVSPSLDGPDAADFAIGLPGSTNSGATDGTAFTIPPNNSRTVLTLRFTPSRVGTHSATLHLTSNDPDESPYDITLTGEGLTPVPIVQVIERGTILASGEGFLRCGTAVIGSSAATQTIHVRNIGTAPLTDFSAEFTGPNASEFSISIPRPIAGGAEGDILVSFAPQDIGPRSAVLSLTSNALGNTPYRITLGGTGAYGSRSNLAPVAIPGWVGTALAELPDGSIVMAGYVPSFDSEGNELPPTSRLRVIGKDGSERTPFLMQHMRIRGTARSMAVREDGGVLIAGDFTRLWQEGWVNVTAGPTLISLSKDCQGVALVLPDRAWIASSNVTPAFCAWSTNFTPPTGNFTGRAVLALPDGKVLVGGSGSLEGRANLIRLNVDGTLDSTFTLPEPNGPVNALAMQDDGKVLVGGEFTNLGHDKLPSEATPATTFPSSTTPRTGLARLNADGSDDATFANRGFHQVMALAVRGDSIAVGGLEKQYSAIVSGHAASTTAPPGYTEIDQAKAQLLGRDGAILATQDTFVIPRAVGLQPGHRMLFTVGRRSSIDITTYSSIALLQPDATPAEWLGVSIASDTMPASAYDWFLVNYQQLLAADQSRNAIHALIAQADGKVLAAGNFITARVSRDPHGYRSDRPNPLPQPSALLPVLDDSPLPPETPLAGFAQLDIDGFYHASPRVWYPGQANNSTTPITDGLATLIVPEDSVPTPEDPLAINSSLHLSPIYHTFIGIRECSSSRITIDGPDAAAFAWGVQPDMTARAAVCFGTYPVWLSFTPTRQGKHRAVLHVHEDGIANDLDIALEGTAVGSLPDRVRLVDTAGHVFQSTETRDLGSVTFGSTATLDLRLFNDNIGPHSTPFELNVTGANASDFTVSPSRINSIPGSTRNGAGYVPITVTFSPSALGSRTATLSLVTVSRNREGDEQRSIPFTITLTGSGLAAPPVFTSQPQDVLVMQGEPLSLSAAVSSAEGMSLEWHQQRGSLDRIVRRVDFLSDSSRLVGAQDSLSFTAADDASAGVIRLVATNSLGSTNSSPAQVGVVSVPIRNLAYAQGQMASLSISFVGPSTVPGSSAATYQWNFNGQPLTFSRRAGVTGTESPTLQLDRLHTDQAGDYTCTVTLGTATLTTPPIHLSVVTTLPEVRGISSAHWGVGVPVNVAIIATQTPAAFTATGLPPGIRLDPQTGILEGRPIKAGTYRISIRATNALGTSSPLEQTITVEPLPSGIAGSYGSYIVRDLTYNDALGGTWSMTVTSAGIFTGKLRMASKTSAMANPGRRSPLGQIFDYAFSGFLTVSAVTSDPPSWQATSTVQVTSATGGPALTLSFNARASDRLMTLTVAKSGSEPAVLSGPYAALTNVPAKLIGDYRADIVSEPSQPDSTKLSGQLSVRVARSGSVVWAARLGRGTGITVATGSAMLSQLSSEPTYEFSGYVFYPHAAGARSFLFGHQIQSYESKPTVWGIVEWGNRIAAPTPGEAPGQGDLYRGGELNGAKAR